MSKRREQVKPAMDLVHPLERQRKVAVPRQLQGPPALQPAPAATVRDPRLTRRAVLRNGMYGAIGLAVAAQAGILGVMFWPAKVSGFGSVIKAGKVSDYKVGDVVKFREGKFYLSRLPEGVMALYWKCVHLGCTVPWEPAEDKFHCPCHGSIYERTGQNIAGPAPRPLDYMAVEVRNGEILVNTAKIMQRPKHDPSHVTPV